MSLKQDATADSELLMNDLGPLAWVLEELRKSLDFSNKAVRRFVRDAELARGSDLSEMDVGQLRTARQHLHQAVGALEMVGLPTPAMVLRAMESVVQIYVQHPELCSEAAALTMDRAGIALTEFLEGVLKGKNASPVALFPQYRAVLELSKAERMHPADLWPVAWRWLPVQLPGTVAALPYSAEVRTLLDRSVLNVVKSADPKSAMMVGRVSMGLAMAQNAPKPATFWAIAAAYFEAFGNGLLPNDIYTRRTASRVLQQYASLAKGDLVPGERLAQDLLFFCWQARIPEGKPVPVVLQAVREAYGYAHGPSVDYALEQFGRFDPAQLALARKRIAAAAETWSALAGGDTNRLKLVGEQFAAVAEAIVKLHPERAALAQALQTTVDASIRSGNAPSAPVAMEVATSILYLEASYEDLDPTDSHLAERSARLAQRLADVRTGAEPEPLEAWMEELYRRVSERQTMGSVVDELRASLADVETSLDQYFRNPADPAPLNGVPGRLAQMRGVFSVLGLDQPSTAALRMRSGVEQLLLNPRPGDTAQTAIFEKMGNSLGAMGLLIDMLSYQRAMAKKLFVYDEALGELKPLMGRDRATHAVAAPAPAPAPVATAAVASPAPTPTPVAPQPIVVSAPPPVVSPVPAATAPAEGDEDDAELREIFLEEAREVVRNGLAAARELASDPANLAEQTTLRRAFHTLKGSARMVDLNVFGESAWAFEQLMNAWLAEQKPASDDLIHLTSHAMRAFGAWVDAIANQDAQAWASGPFRDAADALRLNGTRIPLKTPADDTDSLEAEASASDAFVDTQAGALNREVALETDATLDAPDFQPTQFEVAEKTEYAPLREEFAFDFAPTRLEDPVAPLMDSDPTVTESTEPADFGLENLDFSVQLPSVSDASGAEPDGAAGRDSEVDESEIETLAAPLALDFPDMVNAGPEPEPALEAEPAHLAEDEEPVKVIGDLRLSIPFYNVYLNEADEWSRRLQTELSEWALELHRPVPASAVALAHSLAGSSATVGFKALAHEARLLEHALDHLRLHEQGTAEHAKVANRAAEDMRRLLHQFAAGFLKDADPAVERALQALIDADFSEDAVALAPEPEPAPVKPAVVAVAAPLRFAKAHDDELDAQDRLDPDLFPYFQEEAVELMPALGAALRQWVAHPDHLTARRDVLRVLHTLKGSARLAGAMRLGEMSHRMESGIEELGSEGLQSVQLEPLLARFDALQETLDALAEPQTAASQAPVEMPREVAAPAVSAHAALATRSATQASTPIPARPVASQSVRVRAQLLDRLVNQAGEVMISRSSMEGHVTEMSASLGDLRGNLDRLRGQLRDIELQAETQMQSRMALSKESTQSFDPLEFDRFTRVQELTRMMAESVNDVATVQRNLQRIVDSTEDDLVAQGRQARELQRDLLRTRMVEFEMISDRLYGVVRQAAKEAGKQVRLDIEGGSFEMDRGVLDRMTPAFEHILRNAVSHGIEPPEVRVAAGKPAAGTITIRIHQESNDVSVTFQDDGGGLRLDKIRARAIANKLIAASDELTEAGAANLLFMPGFSTADAVTELSGRGIGMDVVLSELNALGGRVETHTQAGKGTAFNLVLPLTTAVTQVVMLRVGNFVLGVPSNLMEVVLRVPLDAVEQAYHTGSFSHAGESLPFYWAGALLQVSTQSEEGAAKNLPVAVFRSAGQRIVMHLDEVLGNREVVVKNLGPQLSRLPGLAGMSVLASGAVVLIYNPVALSAVYGEQARALQAVRGDAATLQGQTLAPLAEPVAERTPLILVVDDSITVRRVTQRLLKREGYRVALANDGLQALEQLRLERPAMVLSDIEMPRMDGFDLVRNIRSDATLADLPVVMITSRIAQKHRDLASELGVDHYLGKPFSEELLLGLIRDYCAAAARIAA